MFQYDPRLQQIPSARESILRLSESSNQPTVAVPGHEAQPAQAFIVAMRVGSDRATILVSLWLPRQRKLAVFVHDPRHVGLDEVAAAIGDAKEFCESMGFILDEIPWQATGAEEQLAVLDRLPPFRKPDPQAELTPGLPRVEPSSSSETLSPDQLGKLGRLLASFSIVLALLLGACAGISDKDRELGRVHQHLAQESLAAGDPRAALAEIEKAVAADPENAEAHNLYGLLLHLYFGRLDGAAKQYRRAIEIKPGYSEAKVNLGAIYTAQDRCEKAVPLFEEARADLLYREPYLAENNLGWCLYKLGNLEGALLHLRAAVTNNPGFCLGWRNLGEIAEEQGRFEEALRYLNRYAERCPTMADADFRRGVVLLKSGDSAQAREAFVSCREKAGSGDLAEECDRQARLIPRG